MPSTPVLGNLATQVYPKISQQLDNEIKSIVPDNSPFKQFIDDTIAGKFVGSVNADTSNESIETNLGFTSEDEKRLQEIELHLNETAPISKAKEHHRHYERLKELIDIIDSFNDKIDKIEKLIKPIEQTWQQYPNEEQTMKIRNLYDNLRATIELMVQNEVLNRVVQRYDNYIRVKNLEGVIGFNQSEYDGIYALYQKCCDLTSAHDAASAANLSVPEPDEVRDDLEKFRKILSTTKSRKNLHKKS